MLICYFNIRKLGGMINKNKEEELILSKSMDFVAIQETEVSKFFDSLVHSM